MSPDCEQGSSRNYTFRNSKFKIRSKNGTHSLEARHFDGKFERQNSPSGGKVHVNTDSGKYNIIKLLRGNNINIVVGGLKL